MRGATSEKTKNRATFWPQTSIEEMAAITVPFEAVEGRLKDVMAEHGVAVVTGILTTEEERTSMENELTKDLQELLQGRKLRGSAAAAAGLLLREGPASLSLDSARALGDKERCQLRGLPQGRFAWAARMHPHVRRVYEVLHRGEGPLVSSCDNAFFAPASAPECDTNREWGHVDHNSNDRHGALLGVQPDWAVYQACPCSASMDTPSPIRT